jgi:heme/copper-type cytochrome/quinol oxidase subunit 2
LRFIFIRRKWIVVSVLSVVIIICGILFFQPNVVPVNSDSTEEEHEIYTFHMVTGEFKTKTKSGKTIEAYRWDPGTIVVPKDKEITLSIYGVNGEKHPFFIEGTNVSGTVEKGKETKIKMKFTQEGTYRLICTTHPDKEHNGPMIAYIVVD